MDMDWLCGGEVVEIYYYYTMDHARVNMTYAADGRGGLKRLRLCGFTARRIYEQYNIYTRECTRIVKWRFVTEGKGSIRAGGQVGTLWAWRRRGNMIIGAIRSEWLFLVWHVEFQVFYAPDRIFRLFDFTMMIIYLHLVID
jgi:hypothetical protein